MSKITLKKFYKRLIDHNWYFHRTDDHNAWKRGAEEREALATIAKENGGKFKLMFDQFYESMFSGPSFGTPKQELPSEPQHDTA